MHRIYSSVALVIDSKPYGEADRLIILFTREFGLIRAVAKSVRLERSKLRYGLALFSLCEASMVKGREVWRLTTVIPEKTYARHTSYLKKIATLLKRFVGEETHDSFLFDSVKAYFEYVDSSEDFLKEAETLVALHILNRLGYIQDSVAFSDLLTRRFSANSLIQISPHMSEAIALINQALTHAHL